MDEEGTQNYTLLKFIVAGLGILIVIMLAIIIGTAIYRMNRQDEAKPAPKLDDLLSVPAGSKLIDMQPTERELYLHVKDSRNFDHVYALDRQSGALLWHRQLTPTQP
jgi:hypothetical protein